MCWCLSIIELKNARWKIEIRVLSNLSQYTLPQDFLWFLMQIQINIYEMWWSVVFTDGYKSLSWNLLLWNCHEDSSFEMSVPSYQTLLLHLKKDPNIQRRESFALQRYRSPSTYPPKQQDTICCKYLSITLLMMGKILPKTCWADLVDQ